MLWQKIAEADDVQSKNTRTNFDLPWRTYFCIIGNTNGYLEKCLTGLGLVISIGNTTNYGLHVLVIPAKRRATIVKQKDLKILQIHQSITEVTLLFLTGYIETFKMRQIQIL